jgi:peptidoglycan/LPS O-acetylase OafA/YrhL
MFYLLVGVLLLLNRFRNAPHMFDVLAAASAIYWCVTLVKPEATSSWAWPLAGLLLLRHGCFFALGGLLWLASFRGLYAGLILRVVAIIPICLIEIRSAAHTFATRAGQGDASVPGAVWTLAIIAIAASAYYIRSGANSRGAAWLRVTALMTYPLYLLHNVVGAAVLRTAPLRGELPIVAALGTSITLAFIVSAGLEPRLQYLLSAATDAVARPLRHTAPFLFRCTMPVTTLHGVPRRPSSERRAGVLDPLVAGPSSE